MEAQFSHAAPNGPSVSGIAVREAPQPIVDPQSSLSVTQTIDPIAERSRLEDDNLSFI